MFEILSFRKPLIRPNTIRQPQKEHRKRDETTQKLKQNIWRAKRNIKRNVSAVNYVRGAPAFATFTYATPQHNMEKAMDDWKRFTRKIKNFRPAVALLRVPERHKSGAVHFHALMWDLDPEWPCFTRRIPGRKKPIHACPEPRQCERKQRVIANLWGHGWVDLNITRDADAVGPYIAKYLTKGDPDWSLFGRHIVSCNSRFHALLHEAREQGSLYSYSSYKSAPEVKSIIEDMHKRMSLRVERTFDTKWLGAAKYQVFGIEEDLKSDWFDLDNIPSSEGP